VEMRGSVMSLKTANRCQQNGVTSGHGTANTGADQ